MAVVLGSADLSKEKLNRFCQLLDWSRSIGLSTLILYVSDDRPRLCPILKEFLASYTRISLHTADDVDITNGWFPQGVDISLGYGGKKEVVEAFRSILRKVEEGSIEGDGIDEKTIESHLRFSQKPDLSDQSGRKRS